jgi:hypothetical protein
MCTRPLGYPFGIPRGYALGTVRVIDVLAPLGYRSGTGRVPVGCHGVRAGTLDQQKATIERVSKEIGALSDLVDENEAKGRMGQVRLPVLMRGTHGYVRVPSSVPRACLRSTPARDSPASAAHA